MSDGSVWAVADGVIKTAPYAHQATVFEATWREPYWGLLLEMGTGKSKILLDTIAALAAVGEIKGALIVAPKGVYRNWLDKEIPAHLSDALQRRVYAWTPQRGAGRDRRRAEMLQPGAFPILLMNVEALSTLKGVGYAHAFLSNHTCLFAVDESTTIKTATADRTKACLRLGRLAPYRRILTGSPVTKSPLDIYTQAQFLDSGALGFSSRLAFRNRYAIVEKDYVTDAQGRRREYASIIGYRRLDELHERLGYFTTRILKSDCLDLPEKIYQARYVDLSEDQNRAYQEMRREAITVIEGAPAVATVTLTQMLRLHQIVCGHLTTVDGEVRSIPNNRINALLDVCNEAYGKVIIWANYRHDLAAIRQALTKEYGEGSTAVYAGETPDKERPEIVGRFQDPYSSLRFFVGQQRTGGYGLTLTEASTVVYYSNSFDLEVRLQSEDRAHRIGQKNKVTYVDLIAQGTIDERIVGALRNKMNLAAEVLGEGWKEWLV